MNSPYHDGNYYASRWSALTPGGPVGGGKAAPSPAHAPARSPSADSLQPEAGSTTETDDDDDDQRGGRSFLGGAFSLGLSTPGPKRTVAGFGVHSDATARTPRRLIRGAQVPPPNPHPPCSTPIDAQRGFLHCGTILCDTVQGGMMLTQRGFPHRVQATHPRD